MLDDDLGRRLDSFFGRVRDWPVTRVSVSPDLATSVASGLRRVRQRRRLVASGVVAILVAAVALTAAFVAPHRAGAPAVVEPDGTGRPAPSGPVSPSAPVLPSTLVSPSAVDAAPVVTWAQAFHGQAVRIPAQLRDGRSFAVSALVSAREAVGIARPAGARPSGSAPYALVVVDVHGTRIEAL